MSCVTYGHIKESKVLIESHVDSVAKRKRNLVLAIWAIATLIFFPIGLPHLFEEIHREICIREINKVYPNMCYDKCVRLSICKDNNGVMHRGRLVSNPIDFDSEKHKRWDRITKLAFEASLVALVVAGIVGAIIIGI